MVDAEYRGADLEIDTDGSGATVLRNTTNSAAATIADDFEHPGPVVLPDAAEPATPAAGTAVRWYDDTAGAYKIKFDDGTTATIASK